MNDVPSYAAGFVWGLVLLFSFCGWGLLLRCRSASCRWFEFGAAPATGMASAIVAGSVLNLLAVISRPVCLALVAAGIGLLVHYVVRARRTLIDDWRGFTRQATRLQWALALIVLLVVLLRYSASIMPIQYNHHDDYHGYFVYPLRMIEGGSLGYDPFNGRRLVSSLGGQSFLNALFVAGAPLETLAGCDSGVGFVAFAVLATALCLSYCDNRTAALLVALAASCVDLGPKNISSTYVSSALLLLLLHECSQWMTSTARDHVVRLGVLAAAACSVKSSCIPFVLPVLTVGCAFKIASHSFGPARLTVPARVMRAALPLLVMGLCLLPSMYVHWRDCGTPLYPLLGLGTHYTAYESELEMPSGSLSVSGFSTAFMAATLWLPVYGLVIVAAIAAPNALRRDTPEAARAGWVVLCASAAGAVAGVCALYFSARGWAFRYSLPALAAYWAFGLAVALQLLQLAGTQRLLLSGVLAAAMAAAFDAPGGIQSAVAALRFHKCGLTAQQIASDEETARYRAAQDSLPDGARLYAHVDKPFLFNYEKQNVFVSDIPGEASPPPGLTTIRNTAELRDYFREYGISAIAYSYATGCTLDAEEGMKDPDPWKRAQRTHTFRHQQMLAELMTECPVLYKDDELCVIAL